MCILWCLCILYTKMAAWVHDLIKTDIKDIIYEALMAVVSERLFRFEIDGEDFDKFLRAIRIKQVESDGECSRPGQRKAPRGDSSINNSDQASHKGSESHQVQSESASLTPQVASPVQRGSIDADIPNASACTGTLSWRSSFHSHRIHLCIQGDYGIRIFSFRERPFVYHSAPRAPDETFEETVRGMFVGSVLGATVIGSTIPAVGTNFGSVLGAVLGGIVGYKGAVSSQSSGYRHVPNLGYIGAPSSPSPGFRHAPNDNIYIVYETVKAIEVFRKLDEFSIDRSRNMCYCAVIKNTACPYQEYAAEERERAWRAI